MRYMQLNMTRGKVSSFKILTGSNCQLLQAQYIELKLDKNQPSNKPESFRTAFIAMDTLVQ